MDRCIERIMALIETYVTGRGLKQFFNGYPHAQINNASLPAVVVRGVSITSETLTTNKNQEVYEIQVVVLADARNTVNTTDNQNTPERELRLIFEERDTNTQDPKANTIMSAIEKHFMYDTTYNINCRIQSIVFDNGSPIGGGEYPSLYGIMTLEVTSIPHTIKV